MMSVDSKRRVFSFAPLSIDMSWRRLFTSALYGLCTKASGVRVKSEMEIILSKPLGHAIACVSERSAFDLYLSALNLPRGSEILVSAINIQDMATIIEAHGLIPLALDIDPETLSPSPQEVAQRCSANTKALLIAHLYGKEVEMAPFLALAKARNLLVIEDFAQSLFDMSALTQSHSDVKLVSLGFLKNHTAFGGGFVLLQESFLAQRMHAIQAQQGVQSTFYKRFIKFALLTILFNSKTVRTVFIRLLSLRSFFRLDIKIQNLLRAYPNDLLTAIRQRPSPWLLAMMCDSLKLAGKVTDDKRSALGKLLSSTLPAGMQSLGFKAVRGSYWLFPVLAARSDYFLTELKKSGILAIRKSSLVAIGRMSPGEHLSGSQRILAETLHLPFSTDMKEADILYLARRLREISLEAR